MTTQTLIGDQSDMNWLYATALKHMANDGAAKSAVLTGNEDCPETVTNGSEEEFLKD